MLSEKWHYVGIIISIDSPPLDCLVDFGPFYLPYSRSVSWPRQKNDLCENLNRKIFTFLLSNPVYFYRASVWSLSYLVCHPLSHSLMSSPNRAKLHGQQTFCQDGRFVRKIFLKDRLRRFVRKTFVGFTCKSCYMLLSKLLLNLISVPCAASHSQSVGPLAMFFAPPAMARRERK